MFEKNSDLRKMIFLLPVPNCNPENRIMRNGDIDSNNEKSIVPISKFYLPLPSLGLILSSNSEVDFLGHDQ